MWDRNVALANRLYLFTTLLAACLLITGTMALCTGQRERSGEDLIETTLHEGWYYCLGVPGSKLIW